MSSGAYALILKFENNLLAYVGSGMNGLLEKRICRHKKLCKEKNGKLHWHIDYLLVRPETKIIDVLVFPSKKRNECIINRKFEKIALKTIEKFGSSDCNKCIGHLHLL